MAGPRTALDLVRRIVSDEAAIRRWATRGEGPKGPHRGPRELSRIENLHRFYRLFGRSVSSFSDGGSTDPGGHRRRRPGPSMPTRVYDAMKGQGPMHRSEIADAVGESLERVSPALSRLQSLWKVQPVPGRWGYWQANERVPE